MARDTSELRPTTIQGIKSLAKRLKKDRGITHSEALNAAAVQAGFGNYRHAQNELGE